MRSSLAPGRGERARHKSQRGILLGGLCCSLLLLGILLTSVHGHPFSAPVARLFHLLLFALGGLHLLEFLLRSVQVVRRSLAALALVPPLAFAILTLATAEGDELLPSLTGPALLIDGDLLAVLQLAVLLCFPLRLAYVGFLRLVPALGVRSPLLLPGGLLLVALCGALFLVSPRSLQRPGSLSFGDALFTSMSAASVTGLVVVSTTDTFTPFGKFVLLGLIQVGGIGIMTFFAIALLAFGGGLGLPHRAVLQEVLDQDAGRVRHALRSVFTATIVTELVGAVLLYISWGRACPHDASWERAAYSLFHSVSAFCNAGFALHDDSLTRYADNVPVNLIFVALITAGGLGFTVLADLLSGLRDRVRRAHTARPRRLLSIQSKLVLATSGLLVVIGTMAVFGGEWAASERPSIHLATTSLFQSVTTRTAGFNTVDIGLYSPLSRFALLVLMFVGASPGSTGGGLKTVTLAVIFLAVRARLRSRAHIEFQRRRIPREAVHAALVVLGVMATVLTLVIGALLLAEGDAITTGRFTVEQLVFEAVSAFNTVGLTLDTTPHLSTGARVIIGVAMFLGRIGPMTLILVMAGASRVPSRYQYPRARVMIG